MTEEERLDLVSSVEDEFSEPLERLETALEDVDNEITQTGDGLDSVQIDVDLNGVETAIAELETLEKQLDRVERDVNIAVDRDMTVGAGGGDAVAMTSGGRRGYEFDNIDDKFPSIVDNDENVLNRGMNSMHSHAALDADKQLATSANPATMFDAPFGRGTGVAGDDIGDAIETVFGEMGGDRSLRRRFRDAVPDGDKLEEVMEDLRFDMSKFYRVFAALIPLVGVFVGALPAAITGVIALGTAALGAAGALAGIGALGAAGYSLQQSGELSMEPITERLGEVTDAFAEAFGPLARKFAPVFEEALLSIEQMAGPLAQASSGLLAFRDEFEGMFNFLEGAIPSAVSGILSFTEAAMPIIDGIINTIIEADILGFLSNQLAEALPQLVSLASTIANLIPAIVHLSQGFLVVAQVIGIMLSPLITMINTFPVLGKVLGLVIGSFLTLVSLISLHNVLMSGASLAVLNYAKVAGSYLVAGLIAAYEAMLTYTGSTVAATVATAALTVAVATLVGVLTLGVGALASHFFGLGKNIKGARKELERFNQTGTALGSNSFGSPSGVGPNGQSAYHDNSTTIIQAGDRDDAARQQYSSAYEKQQHVDSVFGG